MNEAGRPLESSGLVAISTCGHWWVYPWRMALGLLHELVAFHAATVCSFCVTEWENGTSARARPVSGRRN